MFISTIADIKILIKELHRTTGAYSENIIDYMGFKEFDENEIVLREDFKRILNVFLVPEIIDCVEDWLKIKYDDLPLYINNYNDNSTIDEIFHVILNWRLKIGK